MAPPSFSDLGKSAKDLFGKGYAHGFMKLDVTSDLSSNIQFKSSASHELSSQKLNGNIEAKYKVPEHGLTISEKWNTHNQLTTVVELKDKILRGLKLTLDMAFKPHEENSRRAVAKVAWACDKVHLNGDVSLFGGPLFTGSVVAQLNYDLLIGAQLKGNLEKGTIGPTVVSIGRKTADYTIHTHATDGNDFGWSMYHRVHPNFEYGLQMGWKRGDDIATWAIASKYAASPELTLRAKLDHKSLFSISAMHKLSDALKLTLSSHFGLSSFPDAQNKVGFGLEYCPPGPCCGGGSGGDKSE